MALSDMAVRHARVTGTAYALTDADGLSLYVSAGGSKIWHFRYCWFGRQQRMSLGSYPQVGLKEARASRDEARALVADGINPCGQRKEQKRAAQVMADYTFASVYAQWLAFRALELKEGRQSTLSQIRRIFKKDVLPHLGGRSIFGITRHDLLDVLSRVELRDALTTAEKCRTWFNQLFRYALVRVPGLEINPALDLDVVAIPKPPVDHNPFLEMHELSVLLPKMRAYGGAVSTVMGLFLLLLTGVRTGELRLATPDQFDLKKRLWVIPSEVVKQLQVHMRKTRRKPTAIPPYIVPLSHQAVEIVRLMLSLVRPGQRYLFSHRSRLNERISENTLNSALHRLGYADRLTGHGMRATITTALTELGYPQQWIDAQLSHSEPNKVRAAYTHAQYVEQRRAMMQDWANRLDQLEQGRVALACERLTTSLEGAVLDSLKARGLEAAGPESGEPLARPIQAQVERAVRNPPSHPFVSDATDVRGPEPVSAIQRQRAEMLAIY